jgi:serine/threonine protein kinase
MEFASGKNLKKFIQDETLSDKFKAKIALQIATALDFLHQFKIVHKRVRAKSFTVIS